MKVVKVKDGDFAGSEMLIKPIAVGKVVRDLSNVFYSNSIPPPPKEELVKLVEMAVDQQNRCSDDVATFCGMKKDG